MTRVTRIAALLVLCLLPIGAAFGFWSVSFFGPVSAVHQNITKDALGSPVYSFGASGPYYGFSNKAITAVNAMHWVADDVLGYDPRDHFDSESFVRSYTILSNRYAQLQRVLTPDANGSVDSATAWMLLGMMAHAAQDFYAHSTWVADGNAGIVDFGNAIRSGSPPGLASLFPAGIGNVCADPGGVTLLTLGHPKITTGYYKASSLDDLLFTPLPSGKCQHGTLVNAALRCGEQVATGGLITPTAPNGINHDAPCEFNDALNTSIELNAEGLAAQETLALVQAIVKDLAAANNNVGFCKLLDLDPTLPVCQLVGLTAVTPATASLGTFHECTGGQLSKTYQVIAPAGIPWSAGVYGGPFNYGYGLTSVSPSTGIGPGAFTATVASAAYPCQPYFLPSSTPITGTVVIYFTNGMPGNDQFFVTATWNLVTP